MLLRCLDKFFLAKINLPTQVIPDARQSHTRTHKIYVSSNGPAFVVCQTGSVSSQFAATLSGRLPFPIMAE
jgi:hypothetical protein